MTEAKFNLISEQVLKIMGEFAHRKGLAGVATLACLENAQNDNWVCRMKVCGALRSASDMRGTNHAAVAFSRLSEMMETKKDSGTSARKPLYGEVSSVGGAIIKDGFGLIAASYSSGGTPEDDYAIALHGVTFLQRII